MKTLKIDDVGKLLQSLREAAAVNPLSIRDEVVEALALYWLENQPEKLLDKIEKAHATHYRICSIDYKNAKETGTAWLTFGVPVEEAAAGWPINLGDLVLVGAEKIGSGRRMIDPLAKGVHVHSLAESAIMVTTPDPNEGEVDRILAKWSAISEHAISEWEHSHMSVTTADVRTMADYIKFNRAQTRASNSQERLEMSDAYLKSHIVKELQKQGASYATATTAAQNAVNLSRTYHGKDLFGHAWRMASAEAERLEPGLKITNPK